jgi:hypothetical protein
MNVYPYVYIFIGALSIRTINHISIYCYVFSMYMDICSIACAYMFAFKYVATVRLYVAVCAMCGYVRMHAANVP